MQWPREGLDSILLVRFEFDHLESAQIPPTHQMANTSVMDSCIIDIFRESGRLQCSILPLKIIFWLAYKIEDLLDGSINIYTYVYNDHLVLTLRFIEFSRFDDWPFRAALFSWFRRTDLQYMVTQCIGVEHADSLVGFALCTHGDESETLGLATLPVFDDFCGADFSRLREQYI